MTNSNRTQQDSGTHRKPAALATDEEAAFLANYDASRFPRPSVTVDVALLTIRDDELRALLVRRDEHPSKGDWALPGGFVGIDESLDDAASRVLRDKAGVKDLFVEQLYTFGAPGRDPRTRVVSVAYYALVDTETLDRAIGSQAVVAHAIVHGSDAGIRIARLVVPWEGETGGSVEAVDDAGTALPLAFDHAEILGVAVKRIRGKLGYAPIGFELLPDRFSLRELRRVHEVVAGRSMNKDSFRRRVLDRGLVAATGQRAGGVGHRPPELYRFADRAALDIADEAAHRLAGAASGE
jgi:8-oxo-dGTP diphosphatase